MPNNAYKKYKKINNRNSGESATKIISEMTDRKNALKCNEDTIIRTEIHGIIRMLLKEGKDEKYIIKQLSENERYKKYAIYFENWITDKMKKMPNREERQK